MDERFQLCVDLGVGAGLRSGEVFGLSEDDIDFGGRADPGPAAGEEGRGEAGVRAAQG
jgi:integrase